MQLSKAERLFHGEIFIGFQPSFQFVIDVRAACNGALGDIINEVFQSKFAALDYLEQNWEFCPEDDDIVIWEIIPSGHKKAIWRAWGWHHSEEDFPFIEQGKLPGHEKSLYIETREKEDC